MVHDLELQKKQQSTSRRDQEEPEVEDDGTRDEEEEAPGGGEWERERGCPRGLSPPRYARVGILTPGSRNM